jgi:cob(I)alamin adenosyltransferase
MAKVTTRAGDQGYTGLLGNERVPKYDPRIEALGLIDEATSALGVARALLADERTRQLVLDQQRTLYRAMAEIAATAPAVIAKIEPISAADVAALERVGEELKQEVGIGNRFIIPGDSLPGAALDLARTIVRRAERHIARMMHQGELASPELLRYFNRLSDFLFILARHVENGRSREAV